MINVVQELTRILQAVSHADTAERQVQLIVSSIAQVMGVDVCSLFRPNDHGEMVLTASHGLARAAVGRAKLPRGAGLVGLVVQSKHPLNLPQADKHPSFHYMPETGEESFRSFCGVPLISGGRNIGVLVVQNRKQRRILESEEAFLVTLAAQLALLAVQIPVLEQSDLTASRRCTGIKGAPGIGIGKVRLSAIEQLSAIPDAPCEDSTSATQEWHRLLQTAKRDLAAEKELLGPTVVEGVGAIFDAHQTLLEDPTLVQGVENRIKAGNWLPGALREVIEKTSEMFLGLDDPYLRARHEDIVYLGNKLLAVWRGKSRKDTTLKGPLILVGAQVSVSEIASVPRKQLAGIVCFEGSALSHTAILANALGVPAVMGTGAIRALRDGEELIIDGTQGSVILHASDSVRAEFVNLLRGQRVIDAKLHMLKDEPAVTLDKVLVRLLANTGLLADIEPGLKNGAEGVGLYRTEIPFMIHDTFPTEDEQVLVYRQVLSAYAGKPVYMRTLDIGGDKPLPYLVFEEENPALGWRGIRFCLDNTSVLMTQVRAMLRADENLGNLHILLPMVSCTEELVAFWELLDNAFQQLIEEGVAVRVPPVGVMVEVPAAISMLSSWVRSTRIDFLSIGSNDLSQYLLAMDRNNARIAARYDHLHPAVLREIRRVIDLARKENLPLSLCGEMASDLAAVVLLVGMGIKTLSMSAAKLPRVKSLIRSLTFEEASQLATEVLQLDSASAIRQLIKTRLATRTEFTQFG
ncbi:MAG: phosphoenolpyruvate--protein phosphotransferase [Verrucomicrobia bacterium]|nr:phosphoenolpyruvate--protein phosphotransferase [Verrucomicrobiota bacterium]MDA1069639.1 phosphoenolpyruvate--protein phosphotransferase [Verrucomicrobiota bacterium]